MAIAVTLLVSTSARIHFDALVSVSMLTGNDAESAFTTLEWSEQPCPIRRVQTARVGEKVCLSKPLMTCVPCNWLSRRARLEHCAALRDACGRSETVTEGLRARRADVASCMRS